MLTKEHLAELDNSRALIILQILPPPLLTSSRQEGLNHVVGFFDLYNCSCLAFLGKIS